MQIIRIPRSGGKGKAKGSSKTKAKPKYKPPRWAAYGPAYSLEPGAKRPPKLTIAEIRQASLAYAQRALPAEFDPPQTDKRAR